MITKIRKSFLKPLTLAQLKHSLLTAMYLMLVCNDSKRKHLVIFSVKEDWEVKEIILPKMTVCYEAAESPDRNFVAISGRKDGIAFIKNGSNMMTHLPNRGGKNG
jgi:hypothetical protein